MQPADARVERLVDDVGARARIELAIATTLPSTDAARIFLWLAQYPWRDVTWLGPGHSLRWYHEPATFPLGGGNEAVLLLDEPAALLGPGGTRALWFHLRRRSGAVAVGRSRSASGNA